LPKKKYKLQSADIQFHYQIPGSSKIAIKSDEELKRAIAESVKVFAKYVEIEIPGRPPAHLTPSAQPPGSTGSGAAYQPAKVASSPAQHKPQQQPQQQHHAPPVRQEVPAHSDSALSFSVPGSGSGDKVKVSAQQEQTRFVFIPTPCSHTTRIEINIPTSRQLQFNMTSNVSKLTQTFNLPFDVSPSDLRLEGSNVILMFQY